MGGNFNMYFFIRLTTNLPTSKDSIYNLQNILLSKRIAMYIEICKTGLFIAKTVLFLCIYHFNALQCLLFIESCLWLFKQCQCYEKKYLFCVFEFLKCNYCIMYRNVLPVACENLTRKMKNNYVV